MNTIRHDVFVGNVFHTTTDDQLRDVFNQVGKVIAVRQMTEKETGKAKGYGKSILDLFTRRFSSLNLAFIEFADAAAALNAIRHLDGYELNGRKLRVSFTNTSGAALKDYAKETGQDIVFSGSSSAMHVPLSMRTVEGVVNALSLTEAYDILQEIKALAHTDNRKAKE